MLLSYSLVTAQLLSQNPTDSGLKQQMVISYSSGGWKSKVNVLVTWFLGRALSLACRWPPSCCVFTPCWGQEEEGEGCGGEGAGGERESGREKARERDRVRDSSHISSSKGTNSITRAPPGPNCLSKAPSPRIITLGIWASAYEFGRGGDINTTAQLTKFTFHSVL